MSGTATSRGWGGAWMWGTAVVFGCSKAVVSEEVFPMALQEPKGLGRQSGSWGCGLLLPSWGPSLSGMHSSWPQSRVQHTLTARFSDLDAASFLGSAETRLMSSQRNFSARLKGKPVKGSRRQAVRGTV